MTNPDARRRRPAQRRSAFTVDAILEATAEMIVDGGVERLTTRGVSERAGVSVGTLYQYFANKAELVRALREAHQAEVAAALRAAAAEPTVSSAEALMRRMIRANVDVHLENPRLHRALTVDSPAVGRLQKASGGAASCDWGDLFSFTEERCGAFLPALTEPRTLRRIVSGVFGVCETLTHSLVLDCPSESSADEIEGVIMSAGMGYVDALLPGGFDAAAR